MRDPKLYDVDVARKERHAARLKSGALLYRIASTSHSDPKSILSGAGAAQGSPPGRFHRIQQRASYCSNNMILCFAEMLYHMHRMVLDSITESLPFEHLLNWRERECHLVVFDVDEIPDLVYADSQGARSDYDARLNCWAVVCPDSTYEPFNAFSDTLRRGRKRGIVYPSARHSEDLAFVFFGDETDKVRKTVFEAVDIRLQLIPENQDFSTPPSLFSPLDEKLHATMGFYEFTDLSIHVTLGRRGLVYPEGLPNHGYVDFVRRQYHNYPVDAFRPSASPVTKARSSP